MSPFQRNKGRKAPMDGADAETEALPKPDSIAGRILANETSITTLYKLTERIDLYMRWLMGFGAGTTLFKVLKYDVDQAKEMKSYIKDVVAGSEKALGAQIDGVKVCVRSEMKVTKTELLAEIWATEAKR
ncbi:hypothetical protein RUND412_006974 [Rhizina undulata]